MHPSLRPGMGMLRRLFDGLRQGRRLSARARNPRRIAPAVDPLESRMLMYFSLTPTSVVPSTLWPPNGRFVPVTVSGSATEFSIVGVAHPKQVIGQLPGGQKGQFQVVDEYRVIEPSGPMTLVNEANGHFNYSFTIDLQASRNDKAIAGRRYYITVELHDSDGWFGQTVAVQVPHSLTQRGPGPITVPKRDVPTAAKLAHINAASAAAAQKQAQSSSSSASNPLGFLGKV